MHSFIFSQCRDFRTALDKTFADYITAGLNTICFLK